MDCRRNIHLKIYQQFRTAVVSFLAFTRVLVLTLCRFGALIRNGLPPISTLSLAQEKLAHSRLPFSVETLTDKQTAFALLSRRILLHFRSLQSASATMGSNLIARHLQVAFVVPKHRQFVVSGSPSEPFLIEAAAEMMATTGFSAIHSLLNFANEGLLNAGESDEIVGRLLTIDAYDFALRKRPPTGPRHMYHSWVPVLEFLEALFTDRVYEDIIKIKPYRQPDGRTLGEAFKNAVIRLTHYVRLSHLSLITAANVRKAFIRGMGLVGAASQTLIDIVIPMLFVDLEKGPSDWIVDQTRMSHLMTNWKNKATDATPPHSDPYDDYKQLNMELPTILMWSQFGSKKSEHVLPQTSQIHCPGRAVYFIDLYGIGPEIYRGITATNQQQYQQLVGCDEMFQDAPFIFEEYRSAVECTLPTWSTASFEQTAS